MKRVPTQHKVLAIRNSSAVYLIVLLILGDSIRGRLFLYSKLIYARSKATPEVIRFYGIVIKVFFGDHPPPHFHAVYGEYNAIVSIEPLDIIEGDLPTRAQKLVLDWARLYQYDLLQI